jgi:hypothetical protein
MTKKWIAALCFAVAGCDASEMVTAPEDARFVVRTDSTTYTLHRVPGGFEAQARVVYINRTASTVYFARCDPRSTSPMYGIDRIMPDTGSYFVGGAWGCVGGVPTGSIVPGDSVVLSIWLGSMDSPNAQPPVTMRQRVGQFRILLELCTRFEADSDDCELVAEKYRTSNTFDLKPPD